MRSVTQAPAPAATAWRVTDFLIHLRLHYQFFILAAPFLCGGLLSPELSWRPFLLQFLSVHALLFGGATAYNSFWDKDEGPIGGLAKPPKMQPWMHAASLALQGLGLVIAGAAGPVFSSVYAISAALFWAYSSPHARWKGRPFLSFVAIGLSTGAASLLMGRLAASSLPLRAGDLLAALGVTLMLLSLYPISQIYQLRADAARGDRTFALAFGLRGVRLSFYIFYTAGVILLGLAFAAIGRQDFAILLTAVALVWGAVVGSRIRKLAGKETEYTAVMRLKYATSAAFIFLTLGAMIGRHAGAF